MSSFFGEKSSDHARETYTKAELYMDRENLKNLTLGPYTTFALMSDPKRFGFMLARHKFVAKMLTGCKTVLEIGCQEGFTSLLVAQQFERLLAIDFFKEHIEAAETYIAPFVDNVDFRGGDILDGPIAGDFDGAFSLDVFEHIDPKQSGLYLSNIGASLKPNGVFVLGIPSLESQQYASPGSRAGHINCRSGDDLRETCLQHFENVFMFSMNDEVLHTGFFPMSHYLFALCVGPKPAS